MILIIGESGTGKSTSIENLDHTETFIIQALGKPLPFRGWRRKYSEWTASNTEGNLYRCDNSAKIVGLIEEIDKNMPHIKNIIIDDFQYIMANEFMRRVKEKGYEKFNDIGHSAWSLVNKLNSMRTDLVGIVLSHSEVSDTGKTKLKTLGKMLDDKVTVEGMFTIVMQSIIFDGRYSFITQNNGNSTCKSPRGMFESDTIDNDLKAILAAYHTYNNADLEELRKDMLEELKDVTDEVQLKKVWNRYKEFHADEDIKEEVRAKGKQITEAKGAESE